jgi:hypothetical protein
MALHERTFLQRASKRASARARAGWLAGVVWCGVVWCGVVDWTWWIARVGLQAKTHTLVVAVVALKQASNCISTNKQTNKQTDRQTDRQTDNQATN